MGEIKSTLDLVMEKTRHLNLSETEREEQERAEVQKRINGLLQKYQDRQLDEEQIGAEIKGLRRTHRLEIDGLLKKEIVDRIDLDMDNGPLLTLLRELCRIDPEPIASTLKAYQDTMRETAGERATRITENLARQRSISGSAVVANLDNDTDWPVLRKRIYNKFADILSGQKASLYQR
jgi:hypothetical protein